MEQRYTYDDFLAEQEKMRKMDEAYLMAREESYIDDRYIGDKSNLINQGYVSRNDYIEEEQDKDQGMRRVPVGEFLKLKKDSFLLYCALQKISFREEGDKERYIKEIDLNFAQLKSLSGIKDYRTMKNKLKQLEIDGFINQEINNSGEIIYKLPLVGDFYVLLDLEMRHIKAILELCDESLLRVMLFHKSYAETMKRKGHKGAYTVTLPYIADCIGLSSKSRANIEKIIKCNNALEGFGTIKIEKRWEKKEGSTVERNYYTFKI